MKVTLGGDRLGSGNKQKIALHNYERSTHNLSERFTSSMQCGVLYPFMVKPALRGDKFEIDLNADARTIPTKGPLFGSFKLQVDLFQCDVRLYQAILHNNPLNIGLKMSKVLFPQIVVNSKTGKQYAKAFSNTSLLKYLGMSGIGHFTLPSQIGNAARDINAIPALAYYEIFKTYFANKQEDNAYVIAYDKETKNIADLEVKLDGDAINVFENISIPTYPFKLTFSDTIEHIKDLGIAWIEQDDSFIGASRIEDLLNAYAVGSNQKVVVQTGENEITINGFPLFPSPARPYYFAIGRQEVTTTYEYYDEKLTPFKLQNIDDMRLKLLSYHQLGSAFQINAQNIDLPENWGSNSGSDQTGLPYRLLSDINANTLLSENCNPMNGLVVKTYQADMYNTWINTEWIDGENGIAEITAINTEEGKVKIDSINFSEKLYNMLNRVAVSDGSYEGWQDAVYTETPKRHIESPVYLGGLSSEIVFEEIVQTSQGDLDNPLGTLAGKGRSYKRKGGHVVVKTNEAAFIIGIVSITPRINYTQGNEFYMTDLKSMDDFHKPALDGIGFQDLLGERLAWWDTRIATNGLNRSTIGKIPAWMEYMTSVDKCYGDFAETSGKGFMALQRDYTQTDDFQIADATTYIDPRKYNYAFAYNALDSQNFWVQIESKIIARRLMSAKQIPNI